MTLVEAARAYLGVPWQHQGRGAVLDCLGLLVLSERDTGRDVADRTNYGRVPRSEELRAGLEAHYGPAVLGDAPALADLRPGDRLLLRLADRNPTHVGIVGDSPNGLTLIHAYSGGLCRVVETRLDDKWRKRIAGVFR